VMQYGMSDRVGAIRLGQQQGEVFLGRDMGHVKDYSEGIAQVVDDEVRRLIETAHQEAYEVLVENRDVLDTLVTALLERETLDKGEVAEIFTALVKRAPRSVWLSASTRPVSERGPVLSPKELALLQGPSNGGSSNGNGSGSNGSSAQAADPGAQPAEPPATDVPSPE
ncbi:MAG: cell division protein FtsH, partial [Actinomycetes bacterium]